MQPTTDPNEAAHHEAEVQEWLRLTHWMATAKPREKELRERIATRLFGLDFNHKPGTHKQTAVLPTDSYVAKLVVQHENVILEEVMDNTIALAQLSPEQRAGLIRTKYELSATAYKALPPDKQKALAPMISTKPKSIKLEIAVVPK